MKIGMFFCLGEAHRINKQIIIALTLIMMLLMVQPASAESTNNNPSQVLAGGMYSSYAIKSDGTVWSWGGNGSGQLGNNTIVESDVPVQVIGLTGVTSIASGIVSVYALKSDGTVWSWGRNEYGQLGNNTIVESHVPVQVIGLTGVMSIAGGWGSGYALKSDGTVWSWGHNSVGQLGNNTLVNSYVPVQVIGLTGVTSIAGKNGTGYALKSDGTVWSWGFNGTGELGNNTIVDSPVPVQVIGLTGVTSISSGFNSSYALKSDGTVWSWGYNGHGELGNNTLVNSHVPVQVIGLTGVTSIAGGYNSGYALKSDGTVWSWGYNSSGELGNNTLVDSHVPVQVIGLTGVTSIAGGGWSGYALKSDGTVWSWGNLPSSNIPVQVSNFSAMAVPSAPTGLQVSNIATNSIDLSWSSSSGATGYNVKRATATGGPYTTISSNVIAPNYTDASVTSGAIYYYVVTAVNPSGESANSNEVTATPQAPLPSSPTNLLATAGSGQVSLTWTAVTDATSYNVQRSTTSGGLYISVSTNLTSPIYTDISVTNGTTYYYVVTAVSANGESANSNEVTATPQAPLPSSPTNLLATAGSGQVSLTWTEVTDVASYNVQRSTTSGGLYISVATNLTSPNYTDTSVTNGTTYYYVVTAVSANGESANSNEVSAMPQDPLPVNSDKALLRINFVNGLVLEYDTTMLEVDAFVNWYNARGNGTGPASYEINKTGNLGPFIDRKDYIIYDKILYWEVMEY